MLKLLMSNLWLRWREFWTRQHPEDPAWPELWRRRKEGQ